MAALGSFWKKESKWKYNWYYCNFKFRLRHAFQCHVLLSFVLSCCHILYLIVVCLTSLFYTVPQCQRLVSSCVSSCWPMLHVSGAVLCFVVPYCTLLLRIVPCCDVLYLVVTYCTWIYRLVPLCTVLYLAIPSCTSLYRLVPRCTVLSLAVLSCTSLYRLVPRCPVLYRVRHPVRVLLSCAVLRRPVLFVLLSSTRPPSIFLYASLYCNWRPSCLSFILSVLITETFPALVLSVILCGACTFV